MRLLAIDPGETCGVASVWLGPRNVKPLEVYAQKPGFVYAVLEDQHRRALPYDAVVVEEFRLYPWLAQSQGFSTLPTVKCIGVIEYLCAKQDVPIYLQRADIKKEARSIAQCLGWPMKERSLGSGKGKYRGPDFDYPGAQHPRDALAHAIYWAYRNSMSPLKNQDAEATT